MMLINGFLVELDHHCGVFLEYDTPMPFHIHTVMRTPRGNDYNRPDCTTRLKNCCVRSSRGFSKMSRAVPRSQMEPLSRKHTWLATDRRSAATVYEQMVDPAMPPGRVHPGDERHLAGAFQDNRVVPFEGICVRDLSERSRERCWRSWPSTWLCCPTGHARRGRGSRSSTSTRPGSAGSAATDPETCSTCGSSPRWSWSS
jgi:hypothetical protein